MMSDDPTMTRLDDQIGWYDRQSDMNRRCYKALKVTVIILAALIPVLAGLPLPLLPATGMPNWVLGILGAAVVVIEGIQQLNQHHANWISFRSTCEALKHEKYLYLAKAGRYAAVADAHALLAERVESLVSEEHAKWATAQEVAAKAPGRRVGTETIDPGTSAGGPRAGGSQ
jgi:hypothetical protein